MNSRHCLLTATAIVATAIAAASCGNGKSSTAATAGDSTAVIPSSDIHTIDRASKADTLRYDTLSCRVNYPGVKSSIAIDFPREDTQIAATVRQFINARLADMYLPYVCVYDGTPERVEYKGDLSDPQTMMQFYANGNAEWMKNDRAESEVEGDIDYAQHGTVRKAYEADKYIVYNTTTSTYLGGAHGSFCCYGYVISKLTGKALTQTVDTTKVKQLQPYIRKGVIEYFHECGETDVNASNLFDNLLLSEEHGHTIPLPANTPAFSAKGVVFTYQQYEIAAYCYGLVSFTVPYDDIKPYLVPEAKALLE